MRSKYVWMAVCIAAIWLAVVLVGLFGPTTEVGSVGEAYGLDLEGGSLTMPLGYLAGIATLFILLPIEKIVGKERTGAQKKYTWVTLSIVAIWLAVLSVGLLGLSYEVAVAQETETAEVAVAQETETVMVVVPVALFAAVVTICLGKFVAHFEIG